MLRLKDILKQASISIICFCAVFVCTLFLNYNRDLAGIKEQIPENMVKVVYDGLIMTGRVVSALCGGCLLLTSAVVLCFFVKNYIDVHKKELGILKALGYSNFRIAWKFYVFGLNVLLGFGLGFGGAFMILPMFYKIQNEDGLLPEFSVHFNPELFFALVILPAAFLALLSVAYAYLKLKCPVLSLLREKEGKIVIGRRKREGNRELSFLEEMKKNTARSRKALVFFIWFASFCYSSMLQMSADMKELASVLFSAMILLIGLILAFVTLFLAISTVVRANTKTIAMMHIFGYSFKECGTAILNGYRPAAWTGFAIGTLYQYGLLKTMVTVVFKDWEGVPEYHFNWDVFIIVLISFLIIYELIMYVCSLRIKKISLKEIMLE